MKRLFFFLLISLTVVTVKAPTPESVKKLILLNQMKPAKEEIDKVMTNTKFSGKGEANMQKTVIYASLAMDDAIQGTPQADQLMMDADAAFTKYREVDPALSLIDDPIYQNGPVNLYASFF